LKLRNSTKAAPVLAALITVLIVATVAAAGGSTGSNPNANLRVMITPKSLCVEPFNKKDRHTSFDIKLKDCGPHALRLLWPKNGKNGVSIKGDKGDTGAPGASIKGDTGATGAAGKDSTVPGPAGRDGKDGKDAPTPEYGVAAIDVTRGTSTSTWATYSTALGSPVGDTTGGDFRFTCTAAQAPCQVAVKAAVLSDSAGAERFYPRVNISKDGTPDTAPQPRTYCEYADGPLSSLTRQSKSSSPTYTPITVNIGGTADCFDTSQATTGNGDVATITVPAGYYNVTSTFVFAPAAT
jgi:hypothetical protein